jgi:hypothetical protein
MMDREEARIARTESVFRHVNERIAETVERFDSDEADFVCECADAECHERIETTLGEYEEARADGTHFLVAEGHEEPGYERVVKRRRGYLIVEKFRRGLAAAVRRNNPRTDTA